MHGWFSTRIANYRIEEPFCKLTSFYISGALGQVPDPITWFGSADSYPDRLMYDLRLLGMNRSYLGQILNRTGHDAWVKGRILTVPEFADIVTGVLGKDAVPAFIAAGLMVLQKPVATTEVATGITTTATLNGLVTNDGGEACQYRFRYKKGAGGSYSYTS
jgi:hypothetical protein